MIKLTKKERHEIYKDSLSRIYRRRNSCCCDAISDSLEQYCTQGFTKCDTVFISFPEFAKKKPENKRVGELWWGNYNQQIRMDILKKCIKETEEKL